MAIVRHNKKARNTSSRSKQAGSTPAQVVEVEIHDLSYEAQGVSRSLEKVLFVAGALPGETVKVNIDKPGRRFDQGKLLEIITASDERIEPLCPHYKRCGACQLQHLHLNKQLSYKQNTLDQQLTRQLKLNHIPWQPALESDGFGYRRRARLGVRYRKQQDEIIIGFREHNNRHLAAIDECPVLTPSLSALIPPMRALINKLESKPRITQLDLITADNSDVAVLRYLKTLTKNDIKALKVFAKAHDIQLHVQGDEEQGLECLWPENPESLNFKVRDETLEFTVKNFIQGNGNMNRQMVDMAIDWIQPKDNETLLDLFAGIGNFSLPMARHFKQVVAVEGEKNMVKQIELNAQLNTLDNINARAMNLNDEILLTMLPSADAILLDPPRAGAADMMPWLAQQNCRILYIACEPSSLVRDTDALLKAGYKLKKIAVMDMFPQTKHVETMALFEK